MKQLYKNAEKYLKEMAENIDSTDFDRGTTITIIHHDHSTFVLTNSLIEIGEKFIFVWTEHTGNHLFYKDNLLSWSST